MKTPSITPAQLLAVVKFAVTFFVAQRFLSAGQARTALEVASIVLPSFVIVADAIIRHGRVRLAVEVAAESFQKEMTLLHHQLNQPTSAPTEPKA